MDHVTKFLFACLFVFIFYWIAGTKIGKAIGQLIKYCFWLLLGVGFLSLLNSRSGGAVLTFLLGCAVICGALYLGYKLVRLFARGVGKVASDVRTVTSDVLEEAGVNKNVANFLGGVAAGAVVGTAVHSVNDMVNSVDSSIGAPDAEVPICNSTPDAASIINSSSVDSPDGYYISTDSQSCTADGSGMVGDCTAYQINDNIVADSGIQSETSYLSDFSSQTVLANTLMVHNNPEMLLQIAGSAQDGIQIETTDGIGVLSFLNGSIFDSNTGQQIGFYSKDLANPQATVFSDMEKTPFLRTTTIGNHTEFLSGDGSKFLGYSTNSGSMVTIFDDQNHIIGYKDAQGNIYDKLSKINAKICKS